MKKWIKTIILFACCFAIAWLLIRLGPNLYQRLFGNGNTVWISEQFSEELKEKNEWVVYEATLTGQETVSQNAWLLGKVQEVFIPYSYSITFVVDLSHSRVSVNGNTIEVRVPPPKAGYSKLTVDESNMKKHDWLYPLTPERYAAIKEEIETKLYADSATKQEYLDAAWATTVKNMETLFISLAEKSHMGQTCDISIIMDDLL